jgi:hypothetical protein
MDTLTPELKQAVEQAGGSPVRLMDPETHQAYILVNAEVFERLLSDEEDRREQAAFVRAAKKNAKARLMEESILAHSMASDGAASSKRSGT